jgi:hypothetical protein
VVCRPFRAFRGFQLRKSPDKFHFLWSPVIFAISLGIFGQFLGIWVVVYQSPDAGVSRCEYPKTSQVSRKHRKCKSFARSAGEVEKGSLENLEYSRKWEEAPEVIGQCDWSLLCLTRATEHGDWDLETTEPRSVSGIFFGIG